MTRPTARLCATAKAARAFPAAKALAFREQQHLLTHNDLVLFLRPGDFAAHEWRALRQQIAAVPPPPPPSPSQPVASTSKATTPAPPEPDASLRLTYLRPGLVPAILRSIEADKSEHAPTLDTSLLRDASHLAGPLAAITASTLHPPTLHRVLHLVQKFAKIPPPNAPPPAPDAPPLERIRVLSSLLERGQTAADPKRTADVAKLPPVEVLHAQIVGLLSAPGARISGVLSARSSQLARTLEGFKLGLEEAAAPPAPAADAPAS